MVPPLGMPGWKGKGRGPGWQPGNLSHWARQRRCFREEPGAERFREKETGGIAEWRAEENHSGNGGRRQRWPGGVARGIISDPREGGRVGTGEEPDGCGVRSKWTC